MPVLPRSGPPPLAPGRPATMASGGVGKSMNFVFSREPFACTLVHIPGEIPYRAPKKEKGKKQLIEVCRTQPLLPCWPRENYLHLS